MRKRNAHVNGAQRTSGARLAALGRESSLGLAVCGALALSCGSNDDVVTPYDPGTATIIGGEPGGRAVSNLSSCSDAACMDALERCGDDAAADVIVGDSGEVLDVICYEQEVVVREVPTDQVDGFDTEKENNAVLVLDAADDGVDVEGDVVIDGNNAIVYGEGPDVSIISGTVQLEKNNTKIRGVRIQGDVTIDKNDTKLAFCVIEGDLTIHGNNTTVAECQVHGRVEITGLNTVFVQNGCAQAERVEGFNLSCSDNYTFVDDGDFVVDDGERTGDLECVEKEGSPDPQG